MAAEEAKTANTSADSAWTSTQVYVMAVICLLIGVAVGYFLRGSARSEQQASAPGATSATDVAAGGGRQAPTGMPQGQPTPEDLKKMADTQAAPLVDLLKAQPNNTQLLTEIGNMYYDARQYQSAIDYYSRLLKLEPDDANVRTDLGTAYFYLGNADRALSEFQTALKNDPKHVQTLFNEGMVKWQGKSDAKGAVASWEKLLQVAPDYPDRAKVQQLIEQAKKHGDGKPGTMPTS